MIGAGATLRANRALLIDNARAAAEVAGHLAAMGSRDPLRQPA